MAATPPGSPQRASRLADVGDALRERADRLGRAEDIDRAVAILADALAATPSVRRTVDTGSGRWRPRRSPATAGTATLPTFPPRCTCRCSRSTPPRPAPPTARRGSACTRPACTGRGRTRTRNWGAAAAHREDWPEAAHAFLSGLRLVFALVDAQTVRRHQEGWLRDARQLPAEAARARTRLGRHDQVVAEPDAGRAVLLAGAIRHPR